jgi:hypothetical protein
MVKLLSCLVAAALFVAANALPKEPRAAWPDGPFRTQGRWILNASGKNVTYAGTNWSGHGEAMVPEGLQHQSIEYIVSKIKSIGINSVRLTYATEMIDNIYANGGKDVDIKTSFTKALGQQNGMKIMGDVLKNNPQFNESTTRLQVGLGKTRARVSTGGLT